MPKTKNAIARYYIIDACLRKGTNEYPTREDLKDEIDKELFGERKNKEQTDCISYSSISKDIQAMKRLHKAPIYFNRRYKVYEYTEKGYSIHKRPLSEDEFHALNYSKLFLNKLKGNPLHDSMESAIEKVISDYEVTDLLKKSDRNILQSEDTGNEGYKWILQILNAICDKDCLEITYKSYHRNETNHIFSAYLLKENGKRWYVIGYGHGLGKILSLGLDRIIKIEMSATKYFREPDFSEDDYFKYCMGIMKDDTSKPEKIVLEFNAFQKDYVLSKPLHKSQKNIEQTNDKLIIELEVYVTHELIQMILAYGEQVKVLEPDTLKKKVTAILKESLKNYKH
mgnify:CR=1 FL=1